VKRALVTGATGFIGRHAEPALRERGYEVVGVGSADTDLLQPTAARELIERVQPTHLLHLAWYAEPGLFWTSQENVRWLEASFRLLHAFQGERVVAAGTSAEYDWRAPSPLVEGKTPDRPDNLYGAAKLSLSQVAAHIEDVPWSFAGGRIFFAYGPYEDPRRLVPQVARTLLAGERAAVSEGTQVRDFMHAADVAGAMCALLDSGDVTGPVNIASGEPAAVRDVVGIVAEAAGAPDRVDYGAVPTRPGDPAVLIPSVARLRDEVGFRPRYTLPEGLRDTVDFWRGEPLSPA
jgi:nucleoside-diphosphate-sugar epimerase